jgi:hypothetical protein
VSIIIQQSIHKVNIGEQKLTSLSTVPSREAEDGILFLYESSIVMSLFNSKQVPPMH